MLFASKFEEICPPEVQDFVYFTASACTKTSSVKDIQMLVAALESRDSTPTAALVWCALNEYLDHFLIKPTLIDYSMSRHLPSHFTCLAVIISNCFFSCPCALQSPILELEPNMLRQWVFGSDGDPTPRGVGFRLSRMLL